MINILKIKDNFTKERNEIYEENGDDSTGQSKQKVDNILLKIAQIEQENEELKLKLKEKNEQNKILQDKIFKLLSQPREQEMVVIKMMQNDLFAYQKRLNDQKRYIDELTHKIVKQNKEKEESNSIQKAKDLLKNDLKEMYNQIKVQVNEELSNQFKEQFQNMTLNRTQDNGDFINPFQQQQSEINQQYQFISATHNNRQNNQSFDFQINKQRNESFYSAIHHPHSRQNSQYTDLQFMNNLLGEANSHQLSRSQFRFGQGNLSEIQIQNKYEMLEKSDQKSTGIYDDEKEVISSQLDISESAKKNFENSNGSLLEDRLVLDQSIFDRLEKLQGLLIKDQKIISQLFFSEVIKSTV